ncbi:uncharacterized protein LOC143881015 [Tasmannia lanceolata]|uniref:uncharacterized protein LOC143881015 n=1 Tax=Tasmannia lanceolata TaxID=3420 RepID=UPI0040645704
MAGFFLRRRRITIPFMGSTPIISKVCNLYSEAIKILDKDNEVKSSSLSDSERISGNETSANYSSMLQLSPLLPTSRDYLEGLNIELVDPDLWRVSSGLTHALRVRDETLKTSEMFGRTVNYIPKAEKDPDFDEIEDMRLHGNLFYKLDRDSREFEEYSFDFHRKNSSKKSKGKPTQMVLKNEKNEKENKRLLKHKSNAAPLQKTNISRLEPSSMGITTRSIEGKKMRTPTYNQLTDPYHLPFCLDIYISKSSVRACIVHRVTSKVVVVAHSISKDMKYDLVSTKDSSACVAVGGVLAQRAIADDIHNCVYTPRKGGKLEGKLQIVLQSVIDHGIDVKVKIKQRTPIKRDLSFVK